jgi:MFS family permease
MLAVAVGWHVYALTHDPLALGLVGLCQFLPFISLVLLGGQVADRAERRAVVIRAYALGALCALALLLLTMLRVMPTWPIYVVIGVYGASRAFWAPALQAMLPRLVSREEFPAAVALNTLLFHVAVICGPVLGGLLYLFDVRIVYGACLLLFALTVLLMVRVRADTAPDAPPKAAGVRDVLEGLRYVLRNRTLLGVISLDLFAVLFGGAVALLPIFASDVLHTGPLGLGLLRAAPGAGAAVAGAVLALRPLRDHAGRWLFGGVAVFGASMVVFALSQNFALSWVALLASGAGDMISMYVRGILVQLNTPDAIRGRVSAVNLMFIGTSNELGEFESGLTASWFGTVPAVVAGGVATLVVAGAWSLLFPPLRRLRHLH